MTDVFHYTDRRGYNGISAQPHWRFRAEQPPAKDRPKGAYFTTITPTTPNLRLLCKRLRIPSSKKDFVFWFTGTDGLTRLNEGRGRDQYILHSPDDYEVPEERQRGAGRTDELAERFP